MTQPSGSRSFDSIPNHLLPSIFEILCRDKLDGGLQPAFSDITRAFTRDSNRPLGRFMRRYSDELFLVFNGLLQFKYLFQYDGTFGENFYGLKRLYFDSKSNRYRILQTRHRVMTLLLLLIAPYIRFKLEKKFKSLTEMTEYERFQVYRHDEERESMELFIKCYPYLDALIEAISFGFKMAFLFGSSRFDDVLNWMLSQSSVRIDLQDLQRWKHQKDVFKSTFFQKNRSLMSMLKNAPFWLLRMLYLLGNSTKIMTLAVLFGFKWVEWFFMEEDKLIQRKKLPVPPPPKILKPTKKNPLAIARTADASKCSICGHERTNSSAIPSGYVFCYNCIFPFVQKHRCCPITKQPCAPIQIRRIYE